MKDAIQAGDRPQPGVTHRVENQPPPLVDYNLYDCDAPLVDALRHELDVGTSPLDIAQIEQGEEHVVVGREESRARWQRVEYLLRELLGEAVTREVIVCPAGCKHDGGQ